VDPGATGPVEPEAGFELEVAHRSEAEAPDRSCILVRFTTARRRFDGKSWSHTDATVWRAEDERRAAEEQREAEREGALREQRRTSELLPEEED